MRIQEIIKELEKRIEEHEEIKKRILSDIEVVYENLTLIINKQYFKELFDDYHLENMVINDYSEIIDKLYELEQYENE